jgi:uridine kinase
MKGDKIIVQEFHVNAARQLTRLLLPEIRQSKERYILAIAGESGSGKSEVAEALSDFLSKEGVRSFIIQQDDYFLYPPKTNESMRRKNFHHVGLSEVNLDLLDQNLRDIAEGTTIIGKPLVIFDEDRITEEEIDLDGIDAVIVEGTYTTLLKSPHKRVFIDRTYEGTRESRKIRNREAQDQFLEKVLEIEHSIISEHKMIADIIVDPDYVVRKSENGRRLD